MRPVGVSTEVALAPGDSRPFRTVNHVVDSPLRGDFVATLEPTGSGTRITWSWDVSAANRLLDILLLVLRPLLTRSLQRDLDDCARAAVQMRA